MRGPASPAGSVAVVRRALRLSPRTTRSAASSRSRRPARTPQKSQLRCAYSFFIQGKDGSYVNYHLDLPRFLADGAVRFVEYGRGICSIDASAQIESAPATFDTDPMVQGKTFIDVFRQSEPDVIELFYFDDLPQRRPSRRPAPARASRKTATVRAPVSTLPAWRNIFPRTAARCRPTTA